MVLVIEKPEIGDEGGFYSCDRLILGSVFDTLVHSFTSDLQA